MNDTPDNTSDKKDLRCSFCDKSCEDAGHLIAGHQAYICDECIEMCNEILRDKSGFEEASVGESSALNIKLLVPEEINKFLDDYVIGQAYAKKALSVAVYNHYKKLLFREKQVDVEVELGKSNILLIGPTGSGKTLLAETLARMLNVPFAIADATTLTEAGYVGEDVENVIQKLLQMCDYDVEKAQRGIVYIDEIDKISRKSDSPSLARDVSGEGVQQGLLKLIEGTIASVPPPSGRKYSNQDYLQVDTSNILFICGGAFDGLERLVQSRTEQAGIGFSAAIKSHDNKKAISELLRQTEPEDLIKYGLIPEFVGRLPVVAVLDELSENDLIRILKEPKNALIKQYHKLFKMDGVEIEFSDGALLEVAKKAMLRKSGARGLRSILEHILLDTMYKLPSLKNLRKVVIEEAVIKGLEEPDMVYDTVISTPVSKKSNRLPSKSVG